MISMKEYARPFRISCLESGGMILSLHFLEQLDDALKERRIGEGIRLLENAGAGWANPDIERRGGAGIALRAAQWLDVGYRDRKSVESLLSRFSLAHRSRMPLRDYLELRLAEAFRALMAEDADTAIELLEFVLKAERELGDKHLIVMAHFWKGRAHRREGESRPPSNM